MGLKNFITLEGGDNPLETNMVKFYSAQAPFNNSRDYWKYDSNNEPVLWDYDFAY